jgi:outer membrane protein TolC
MFSKQFDRGIAYLAAVSALGLLVLCGCHLRKRTVPVSAATAECKSHFAQIDYPDACNPACEDTSRIKTAPPPPIADFDKLEAWPLTLEEAIELALSNGQVLNRIGGIVVNAPQGAATVFDPALLETDPLRGAEAALADFDTQFQGDYTFNHRERGFVNPLAAQFQGGISNIGTYNTAFTKTTGTGAQFSFRNLTDYAFSNSPVQDIPSTWQTAMQAEWRQPLARGFGTAVNRIAGPNAVPGVYNGVLIGRIRGDVALTDFEAAVRDLVFEVERAYWELYFAWRDLDVQTRTRESSRLIWDNRKKRVDAGLSRPDDEAQTRQNYFQFAQNVVNAFSGINGQGGVLGAERQLRRLMCLLNTDGRLIRPVTEPTIAPVLFDWEQSEEMALQNRVELRRQKWIVRQRELELFAARKLNRWRIDFVGNYAFKGFGDNLFGSSSRPNGSAVNDLWRGDLDDWGLGFEVRGPVGNRQGHLAARNAELLLIREEALLKEQQRQITLDLNSAITEVERAYEAIKNNYNRQQAVLAELRPKVERVTAGDEDIFFLLDAVQRAAQSESAFHLAVRDYNLALQNYIYTSGRLLAHYNIQLVEGGWTPDAQADAEEKDRRFRSAPANPRQMDIRPISLGPVDQSTDLTIFGPADVAPATAPTSETTPDSDPDALRAPASSPSPSDRPVENRNP